MSCSDVKPRPPGRFVSPELAGIGAAPAGTEEHAPEPIDVSGLADGKPADQRAKISRGALSISALLVRTDAERRLLQRRLAELPE